MNSRTKECLVLAAAVGAGMMVRSAFKARFSFRDKSVLITGGSRGLGLEIARLLAAEGANVAIAGRDSSTLETARTELEGLGGRVLAVTCDVRSPDDIEAAVAGVVGHFGRLDVLINNAGVIQVGPFEQMTADDYENAIATHAWGSLHTISAALPHMRRQGAGRIVNIASIGGKLGVPHLLPYVVSKFAQAGLSEAIGAEIAHEGILVTTVYPGLMRTGSHVNASFKGNNQSEFAWFSIAAGMPLFSINARRAARQILDACRKGKARLIITPAARLGTIADALFPGLVAGSIRVADALLPAPRPETGNRARSGWESQSRWSPSILTRLADAAVVRNNEYRAVL